MMAPVKTALTVNDFIRHAEQLYGHRVGVIDEPDQPAESWGGLASREIAERPGRSRPDSTLSASATGSASPSSRRTPPAC